jgi:hypothetical protein
MGWDVAYTGLDDEKGFVLAAFAEFAPLNGSTRQGRLRILRKANALR